MNKKYDLSDSTEMVKRKSFADDFYFSILNPEEIPFVVTDDASLYDIYIGDEKDVILKIEKKYGIILDKSYFKLPLWKLLDFLEKNKKNDY